MNRTIEAFSFRSLPARIRYRTRYTFRPAQIGRPVFGKPEHNLVIFFDSERLAFADPQKEPTISRAEAPDGGFIQLACLGIEADKSEQV